MTFAPRVAVAAALLAGLGSSVSGNANAGPAEDRSPRNGPGSRGAPLIVPPVVIVGHRARQPGQRSIVEESVAVRAPVPRRVSVDDRLSTDLERIGVP
jgi:hypothetical protein